MSFLIGLLTAVMVLDCLMLILLVLIQLPKKDAGAGMAFGGGAADALFGAGSGNVLTKATKWAAIAFFVLLLILGYMQSQYYHRSVSEFQRNIEQQNRSGGLPPTSLPATPSPAPRAAISNMLTTPPATITNAPAAAPAAPEPAQGGTSGPSATEPKN